jgi:hypothetical protein
MGPRAGLDFVGESNLGTREMNEQVDSSGNTASLHTDV